MSGFVPPSGLLGVIPEEKMSAFNKNYASTPLRLGVIVKIHEVSDDANLSKVFVEYDVLTDQQNGEMGQSFVRYSNCMSSDSFGGVADFVDKKLRISDNGSFSDTYQFGKQNGTLVLLLCADGFTDKGVIIGGFQNSARKTTLPEDGSLHLEGEYNGLNWKIDKSGSLTVTFRSATDNDGKPSDETAGGSFFSIDDTGSIDFNTSDGTNIKIDKPAKDIHVTAGNNINIKGTTDILIEGGGKFTAKSTADFLMEAGGSAVFSSKSKINIEGKGKVSVKGSDINVESKAGLTIKGKSIDIDGTIINLGKGGTPALLLSTKFIGPGNMGVPVISNAVGPFSTSVFIK